MNKDSFIHLVEKKLKEVSQVFSQNSTALAREYTLVNSLSQIASALEELLPEKVVEEPKDTEKEVKKNIKK